MFMISLYYFNSEEIVREKIKNIVDAEQIASIQYKRVKKLVKSLSKI